VNGLVPFGATRAQARAVASMLRAVRVSGTAMNGCVAVAARIEPHARRDSARLASRPSHAGSPASP
jgi:hypothetical protein